MNIKEELRPSLVVTTYNWPEALTLVFDCILRQTYLPSEVIIADDGSDERTKAVIDQFRETAPFPVIHVWQEDLGFRAAEIRNKAISASSSEYIIIIDGDILIHPDFVKDHARRSRPGFFIAGGRILLSPEKTTELLDNRKNWLKKSELSWKQRLKLARVTWLSSLMYWYKAKNYRYGASCNMSFYRKDIEAINGFDEEFQGYGVEDFDLMLRFMNSGTRKRYLRFCALSCHLHHTYRGGGETVDANNRRLRHHEIMGTVVCRQGLCRL